MADADKVQAHRSGETLMKPRFSVSTILTAVLVFSSILLLLHWGVGREINRRGLLWPQGSADTSDIDIPESDVELEESEERQKLACSLPTARYDIDTNHVACYPSSGGIWMAELGPVELQYLGINRFESTERDLDQDADDAFCRELRLFGGMWYDGYPGPGFRNECIHLHEWVPLFTIEREVGFPETGGVWVLEPRDDGLDGERYYPRGISMVRNSLTMTERCMVLERLGAVFCEDIEGCPALEDMAYETSELAKQPGRVQRDEGWCGTDWFDD